MRIRKDEERKRERKRIPVRVFSVACGPLALREISQGGPCLLGYSG
jgi:hypothetical protein